MCWVFGHIIKKISKRYEGEVSIIRATTYRCTDACDLNYSVCYIMKIGDSPDQQNHLKYAMFVRWKKVGKLAVIIGQNPSKSKTLKTHPYNVDDTNWNIVKFLKKHHYAGYVMLNTIPDIDPNGAGLSAQSIGKREEDINIEISNFILKHMKIAKTILACSITNDISHKYFENVISKKKVYKFSTPPITHFATQALSNIKPNPMKVKRIKIRRATPKIEIISSGYCKIDF